MKPITKKQEQFCQEYLIDMNATQACIRAGYSAKSSDRVGPELLGKTGIQKRLADLIEIRSEKTGITAEWILKKATQAFEVNAKIIFDKYGNEMMTNATAARGFLELAGKHVDVQAFRERLEVTASISHEEALEYLK